MWCEEERGGVCRGVISGEESSRKQEIVSEKEGKGAGDLALAERVKGHNPDTCS